MPASAAVRSNMPSLTLRSLAILACASVMGCTTAAGTRLRLVIGSDVAGSLTALRTSLTADGGSPVDRRASFARELVLLVPDDWAGRDVRIVVDGFDTDARIATARATARPIRGEEIRVPLLLGPLSCGTCADGTIACDPVGVVRCERGSDGCTRWTSPVPCEGTSTCSLGTCRETCVDECSEGTRTCSGPGAVRSCGESDDGDTCRDWLPSVECPPDQSCSGDLCRMGSELPDAGALDAPADAPVHDGAVDSVPRADSGPDGGCVDRGWATQMIDSDGDRQDLARDPQGNLHAVSCGADGLQYVTRSAITETWSAPSLIGSACTRGLFNRIPIAIGAASTVVVLDAASDRITARVRVGSTWGERRVATASGGAYFSPSVWIVPGDGMRAHATFILMTPADGGIRARLHYAQIDLAGVETTEVNPASPVSSASIAVSSTGEIFIPHFSVREADLVLARGRASPPTSWVPPAWANVTIASAGMVGFDPVAEIGADDTLRVLYGDAGSFPELYIRAASGEESGATLSAYDVWSYDLSVSDDRVTHVVYSAPTGTHYARFDRAWVVADFSSPPIVGARDDFAYPPSIIASPDGRTVDVLYAAVVGSAERPSLFHARRTPCP